MKAVLIRQKTHPSIPRSNPLERIAETIEMHNPDLIVAPEYFLNNEKRIYTRQEKDGLVQKIADISGDRLVVPGTILWQENGYMRNTVVAVSNGKVLAEHDKSIDGGESLIAQTYGLLPFYGNLEACVFPWKGLDIGIEICCEHKHGSLKIGGTKIDLQIVSGHGSELIEDAFALKSGGYIIICDGMRPRINGIRIKNCSFLPGCAISGEDNGNTFIYSLFPEGR